MIAHTSNPADFAKLVQDALNRLYDSPYLQNHPLTKLLVNAQFGTLQASQEMRRILLQAIHAMRPQAGAPALSVDWRNYQILDLRYIEGISPAEIMDRLGLSKSQYFRDQSRILDVLATELWTHWQQQAGVGASPDAEDRLSRSALTEREVERLRTSAEWQSINAVRLLEDLRILVESLAQAKRVKIHFNYPYSLSDLRVDRIMLRQTLLNVITDAFDRCQEGMLSISTYRDQGETGIAVVVDAPGPHCEAPRGMGLHVSEELMAAMGGSLSVRTKSGNRWGTYLAWSTTVDRVLLVVDDNEEFANLCHRYLTAHNWRVMGASGAAEARCSITEKPPSLILLDVMMPKEDGWELLMALKSAQGTRDIPVIVCSVLNEPELAMTLGATAYLTKPLSQQTLLRALTRWSPVDTIPEPALSR